jgi:AraC-like DNA-binding protein
MEMNETLSGADQEFVNRAMAVVRLHLSDADFTTQQLVSEMATSKTTLFNKLKTLTGKNATTFIRDIRMDHARRIMDDEPDVRISEVAYRVGYNDPKYFSLCFKNCFGISPSVYLETKGGGT